LYRHRPSAADSEQRTSISIGKDALFEYLPDAVIPYAGSRHVQRTDIRLADGAKLFWWEVLAPGRQAAGERFAFERLRVESDVRACGRPVLRESFLLEPRARPLEVTARMQDYSHLATFCACQAGRPPGFWATLEDTLNQAARRRTRPGHALWGASALGSDGVIVRGLSVTGSCIHEALIEFWSIARLAITNEAAVPPRKVY
jgi:urease accessory protein